MSIAHSHTNLTALCPIEHRPDDPEKRIDTVRRTLHLEATKRYDQQLLRNCPMVHMARIQIVDQIVPPLGQEPPDRLKTTYLLFIADLNGPIHDFLDTLYNGPQHPFDWKKGDEDRRRHADFVRNIWGQCMGYPDKTGAVFFRQYIERCRMDVMVPYAAYQHTVPEILEARRRQGKLAEFARDNQGLDEPTLLARWQSFREVLARGGGGKQPGQAEKEATS